MMNHYFKQLSLLITMLITFNAAAQKGYDIKVKITNLKNKQIMLGHYLGSQSGTIDDTLKLDNRGLGSFKGVKPLPQGLYFILLPSRINIDLIIGENQNFAIETDTANFLETLKFTGSKELAISAEIQKFRSVNLKERTSFVEKYKTGTNAQKDSIRKKIEKIDQQDEAFVAKQLKNLPVNSMLAVLLKSTQEVKIPDFPRDANGKVTDSAFQYRYYRSHYFENFDYTDARLLRTPAYEQKMKFYLEKMVPPIIDTINAEVDKILDNTRGNDELFKYVLSTLFYYYANSQIVGMDGVFVHIAEKYYIPYATWSSKKFMDDLKKNIAKIKPTLLGQTAPNVRLVVLPADHFMVAKTDTALKSNPYLGNYLNISDVKTKFLVLVFWEADCGHCQKAMPKLHEVYQKLKDKGVEILAVHAISSVPGKRKWIDFVNEHEMYDWINAWSPYSNEYRDLYDLLAFPAIFILDENKKIISKRIGAEQVEEVINFEMRKKI